MSFKSIFTAITLLLLGYIQSPVASGEGNASDPTASVNFVDLRFQTFDLDDFGVGDDRDRYAVEGAHVFAPGHKMTYEVNYWDTDVTGRDESGLESLKVKYINLTPGQLSGGTKYVFAIGAELIQDLGDVEDGIGTGTDQFAPLIGAGWNLSEKDFLVTLIQYFHSYDEDSAAPQKVRVTGPRLIWIRKIPQFKGWLKIDNKFAIDHENGDSSSNVFEIQLGTMLTPGFGVYLDYLNNNAGEKFFDDGFGVGFRFIY